MGPKNPLYVVGQFEPHDDDPLEGLADATPTDAELAAALARCMARADEVLALLDAPCLPVRPGPEP